MVSQSDFRALVADDDESFRAVLCELLAPFFELIEAADGATAVELAMTGEIHVAVFDWQMPSLTGVEAVQELRERRLEIPCLLMTASEPEPIRQAAEDAEIFCILRKPVGKRTLLSTLAEALQASYADNALSARLSAG